MRNTYLAYIFVFFGVLSICSAQSPEELRFHELDSLMETTNDAAKLQSLYEEAIISSHSHYASRSINYFERANELFDKKEEKEFLLQLRPKYHIALINYDQYEKAEESIKWTLDEANEIRDGHLYANCLINYGFLRTRQRKYSEGLVFLNQAIEKGKELQDLRIQNDARNRCIIILDRIGDFATGKRYTYDILKACPPSIENCPYRTNAYGSLVNSFKREGNLDSALYYLKLYLVPLKQRPTVRQGQGYMRMARLLALRKDYENAIQYADTAYAKFQNSDWPEEKMHNLLFIFDTYKEWKNDIRMPILHKAKRVVENSKNAELQHITYDYLALNYEAIGNKDLAFFYAKKAREQKNIVSRRKDADLRKMQDELNNLAAKNEEINNLNLTNQQQELTLLRKRRESKFYLFLAIALAGAVGFAIYALRLRHRWIAQLREKKDLIEKAVEEKQLLLDEINHRVKNNYRIIAEMIGDNVNQQQLNDIKRSLAAMSEVHAFLLNHQPTGGMVRAHEFIPLFLRKLQRTIHGSENLDINYDVEDVYLSDKKALLLALSLNEVVTNIYKYEKDASEIARNLELSKKNDRYNLKFAWPLPRLTNVPNTRPEKRIGGLDIIKRLLQSNNGSFSFTQRDFVRVQIEL